MSAVRCIKLASCVVRPSVTSCYRSYRHARVLYSSTKQAIRADNDTCSRVYGSTSGNRWTNSCINLGWYEAGHHQVRYLTVSRVVQDKTTNAPGKNEQQVGPEPSKPEVQKDNNDDEQDPKTLTVVQKLKKMFKEYWYVLVPVHLTTSVIWLGSFYYMAKSGIDIIPLFEYLGAGETLLKPLRDTGAGYWAVSYALYKLITPIRYPVTLGGTTLAINYLNRWGLIRPLPSSDQMKAMFREKRRQLKSKRAQALAKINAKRKVSSSNANVDQKSSTKSDS